MATGIRRDPYRNFKFRVEIDGIQTAGFSEATIPESSTDTIDYREGTDAPVQRKLSGLVKYGNITLKKGITDSMEFYQWRRQVEQLGAGLSRKNLSLVLMDEEGNDKARWNITDAWPIKYAPTEFTAKGNDVLIESFEIAHEGIIRVS